MTYQEAKHIIEQYWKLVSAAIEKSDPDEFSFANNGCIYLYIKGGVGDNSGYEKYGAVDDGELAMRVDPYGPDAIWCCPVDEDAFEEL